MPADADRRFERFRRDFAVEHVGFGPLLNAENPLREREGVRDELEEAKRPRFMLDHWLTTGPDD